MSSRPHPGSERRLHSPPQRFDLGAEVGRLMEEGLGNVSSVIPLFIASEAANYPVSSGPCP